MAESQRDKLQDFVQRKGLKIQPWAVKAGVAESAIRGFLKGRTASLTHSTLEKLAAAAGITVGEMLRETPPANDVSQFVKIRHLEVRASAGDGFEVTSESEGTPFYLEKTWLEKNFGGHDGALRVIHFQGDSMFPTIQDGDLGIVLTGADPSGFHPGKIYVLWDGQGLVVKRLETIIGPKTQLRVISDNKELYQTYEIDYNDARIVGRVLWISRKI